MEKTTVRVNKGEVIKKAREEAGLTRSDIARKMNVDITSVIRWETNVNNIKPDNLIKLSKIINVSELFDIRCRYRMYHVDILENFIEDRKKEGYSGEEIMSFVREAVFATEEVRYV